LKAASKPKAKANKMAPPTHPPLHNLVGGHEADREAGAKERCRE
jgi:hypothetical protein